MAINQHAGHTECMPCKSLDAAMWLPAFTCFAGTCFPYPSFPKRQADLACSLVNVYSVACGRPQMLGGGELPHPTSKCVQSSLCEPNLVLRRTAAAVRAPLRRCPRYRLSTVPGGAGFRNLPQYVTDVV